MHVDNKGKDILILGEGPAQGLDDIKLTAEAKYPINLRKWNKRFATGNVLKDFTIDNMKKTGLKGSV